MFQTKIKLVAFVKTTRIKLSSKLTTFHEKAHLKEFDSKISLETNFYAIC